MRQTKMGSDKAETERARRDTKTARVMSARETSAVADKPNGEVEARRYDTRQRRKSRQRRTAD